MHWQDGRAAAGEQWSNGGGTAAAAAASAVLDCCVDEQSQISEEVEFGIKSISHQKGKYETKEQQSKMCNLGFPFQSKW